MAFGMGTFVCLLKATLGACWERRGCLSMYMCICVCFSMFCLHVCKYVCACMFVNMCVLACL